VVKVKALYHFLDKKACRNRLQGDVFYAPEEWAKELEKAGLITFVDVELKDEAKKPSKKNKKNPKE